MELEQAAFEFPLDCKLMLQAIPISFQGRGGDKLAWVENPRGIFYLKSAYGIAMGDDTNLPFTANWIWKLATLPRIKFFLWKCAHNSIGMKDCLVGRGLGSDDVFSMPRGCRNHTPHFKGLSSGSAYLEATRSAGY